MFEVVSTRPIATPDDRQYAAQALMQNRFEPKPDKAPLGNSCSCGCFVCVSDWWHGAILSVFLIFPVVIFVSSVVPSTEWWSILIACVFCILGLVMNILASGMDPGIVPPASVTGKAYNPDERVTIIYNGEEVECRVCPTCLVPKPPGSGHCRWCDNCVEEFDHHCGVTGSCVAKRNFRFFAYYMDVVTILAAYVFIRSILEAAWRDWDNVPDTDWERWRSVAIVGCIVYSCFGGCCVLGPAFMYTQLACQNSTKKLEVVHKREMRERGTQPEGMQAHTHGFQQGGSTGATNDCSCGHYFRRKCGPIAASRVSQYI